MGTCWPVIAIVVGLLLYFAATKNGKVAEVGRLTFFAGLLVTLLVVAKQTIHLLR